MELHDNGVLVVGRRKFLHDLLSERLSPSRSGAHHVLAGDKHPRDLYHTCRTHDRLFLLSSFQAL